jgi:hypothetical protein
MKRVPVTSESVASLGFEPRRCELDVEFRESGDVYRYSQVSADEYAAFLAAESKGMYLNHVFKPKGHSYRVIKRGRRE